MPKTIEELQADIEALREQEARSRRSTAAEQEARLKKLRATYPSPLDGLEQLTPGRRDGADPAAIEAELRAIVDPPRTDAERTRKGRG